MTHQNESIHRTAVTGMLTAIAFLAVLIGRIVPNVAGFLSYDPKDAVIAIGGFIYGPVTALIITVLVSFIEMLTISSTGIYGLIMNIVSTCSFVIPAAVIYRRMHSMKGAVAGLVSGVVCMTLMMMLWNYIITPLYMGVPRSVVAGMMMTTFMPFNLIKSGINAGIAMLLYKPLITALRKAGLVAASPAGRSAAFNPRYMLIAAGVLIVFVTAFLFLIGVL